jgi:hypothetical protein
LLGGLLPLAVGGAGTTYAAVFRPGDDAMRGLSQAGSGWRVLRVLSMRPLPILLVAVEHGGARPPGALLLPMSSSPACLFTDPGR